jgi:predicted dehydrogenase
MSNNMIIAVVGASEIAREYIKVIQAFGHQPLVIGRGESNINEVKSRFSGVTAVSGGLENWLKSNNPPKYAIVATQIDHLADVTKQLLRSGCKHILVEKPLTYSELEAREITELAIEYEAEVCVAFNRRSYISVIKAKELIEADGGVSSFHFDFTEAIFRINPSNYSKETSTLWGIANSSHVIDTAFYLGGKPACMESNQYGKAVGWHPSGSIFTGVGETEAGVPFTYHANWGCPGKWNIELMTECRKLLFSPMERLSQQLKGNFKAEIIDLDYQDDVRFKPGFYKQVQSWLKNDSSLMAVNYLESELKIFQKIFNY